MCGRNNGFDKIFGIFYDVPLTEEELEKESNNMDKVMHLVTQRTEAKELKDWELADSLRAQIRELGFTVKDIKGGDPIVAKIE